MTDTQTTYIHALWTNNARYVSTARDLAECERECVERAKMPRSVDVHCAQRVRCTMGECRHRVIL